MPLLKKGAKTLKRETLKTQWKIAEMSYKEEISNRQQNHDWNQQEKLTLNPVLLSCIRMSWDVQVPFDVFRFLVCRRLVFYRMAGPFITRCPGGFTVSIAFWSKFLLLISIVILLPVWYFFLGRHGHYCAIR
jgi:hypothetical protein